MSIRRRFHYHFSLGYSQLMINVTTRAYWSLRQWWTVIYLDWQQYGLECNYFGLEISRKGKYVLTPWSRCGWELRAGNGCVARRKRWVGVRDGRGPNGLWRNVSSNPLWLCAWAAWRGKARWRWEMRRVFSVGGGYDVASSRFCSSIKNVRGVTSYVERACCRSHVSCDISYVFRLMCCILSITDYLHLFRWAFVELFRKTMIILLYKIFLFLNLNT